MEKKKQHRVSSFIDAAWLEGTSVAQLTRAIKTTYPDLRERLQRSTQDFQDAARIVSFTSSETNPVNEIVMWSHYARHHTGVRVGIEFPRSSRHSILPVEYKNERIKIELGDDEETDENNLWAALFRKSEAWSYEMEHRLLTLQAHCEKDASNGFEFLPLHPQWIRRIDFGLRCPEPNVLEIAEWAARLQPSISLTKAIIHPTKYELCYKPLNRS